MSYLTTGQAVPDDIEPAARALCPAVGDALGALRGAGADHAIVCGSGPTAAGIYWGGHAADRADEAMRRLAGRFHRATVVRPISSPS